LSRQSEPAGGTPACPWPADQVERWPTERRIPQANNPRLHSAADLGRRWPVFTGRAAMHQASGRSFDERADKQAINQEP
jgi:hypothetical protein